MGDGSAVNSTPASLSPHCDNAVVSIYTQYALLYVGNTIVLSVWYHYSPANIQCVTGTQNNNEASHTVNWARTKPFSSFTISNQSKPSIYQVTP